MINWLRKVFFAKAKPFRGGRRAARRRPAVRPLFDLLEGRLTPAGTLHGLDMLAGAADGLGSGALSGANPPIVLPAITWATPAGINYGTPLSAAQLDATSNVAGTFSYATPAGTILRAGQQQTLTVTFTPTDQVDFATTSKSVTIDVNKTNLTITAATNTKAYDATTTAGATPTVVGLQGTDTVTGLAEAYTDANAGTLKRLTVTAFTVNDGSAGGNYNVITVNNATGAISQANLTITAATNTKLYDATAGAAAKPTFTGLLGTDTVTNLTEAYSDANAGTAKTLTVITYAVKDGNSGNNYNVTTVTDKTGAITPMALTITAATNTKYYDATTSAGATPTVQGLEGTDTVTGLTEKYSDINAGTAKTLTVNSGYTINDGNGGANYTVTKVADTTGAITPALLTITAAANTKTYDKKLAATATPTISGLQGTDTVTGLSEAYTDSDAGTHKRLAVNPGFTVNDGNGGKNYSVDTENSYGGVVNQALLTITATNNTKIYDATTTAAATPTYAGLQVGDTITDLREAYANRNVGTGKTLTVANYTVNDGNSGNNYAVTTVNDTTGAVTVRAITVKAATNTKDYDATTAAVAVPIITTGGLPIGDTANFTESYDNKNVGTGKTLTASGTVNDGNAGKNYIVTFVPDTTGEIDRALAGLTITAATNTKTYDKTLSASATPTVTGLFGSDTVTGLSEAYTDSNAGTHKRLSVNPGFTVNDGNGGNNYAVTLLNNQTGVINQGNLTITATTNTKAYDKTTTAAATPTFSALLGTDTVTGLREGYLDPNAGTGKTLTVTNYTVNDGNSGNNYVVTTVNNTTGVINKSALTVTATTNTKAYDGNNKAAAMPTITAGTLALGDTATFTESYDTKNAGTGKTLSASGTINDGNGGNNYTVTFVTDTTGAITPLALTVTAVTNTKVYDGTLSAAAVPTIVGKVIVGDGPHFIETYDNRNVGTGRTLTPSGIVNDGNGGKNYVVTFVTDSTGAITTRAVTVTAATNTKVFDGNTSAAAIPILTGGVGAGDKLHFTETYDNKNAGTGKTLTPAGTIDDGNGGNNYVITFATNKTGAITGRALTVTAATNTKLYDGNTSATGVPTITGGTLLFGDTATFTETYDNKNAGTGKTLNAAGTVNDGNSGKNYTVTFVADKTGAITARSLTVTAITNTKAYDGTTSAAAIPTITGGTLLAGDTAAFTETYDNKNVGTGKTLNAGGAANDGNGGKNYTVTFVADKTGAITVRALTVTAATNTKAYDGTTSAAAIPAITTGTLATGDTANFTETYDTKNAGTGKTVTAGGTVNDGNGGKNYVVSFVANTTGAITTRALTVTAATNTKAYDGTTKAAAIPTITGTLAAGDTANFTETYDTKNVGTGKTLTATGTVNDGNGGNNYVVTFVANKAGAITVQAITVTAATNTKAYDGNNKAAAIPTITTGTLGAGDIANFTETYDTKNVGTGKTLTASGTIDDGSGGNNYTVTFVTDTTGAITPLALTVTAVTSTKVYDGTTSSAAVPTIVGKVIVGDGAHFIEAYDNRNVGTGKTLTASGIVNDGNGGKNYVVSFVADATGAITTRAVTVTATTNTKVFDGNTSAAAIPIFTGGVGAGDKLHFTETYDDKNAGTGKTLTPAGTIDDANGGNNYVITFVTNKTGAITGRSLTVTAATNTKLYDGNTSAAALPTITGGTLLSGDTAAFTETYDNKNAGTGKTLTAAGTVNDGNSGKNYTVTFVADKTGAITARFLTVTAVTNTKAYDGTTSAAAVPTITGGTLAAGDTAAFTETYDNKNVGTGKTLNAGGAANDGNGGKNYKVTFVANTTGAITTQAITVTAATNTKAYDGTISAAAVPTISGGTLGAGDTANFTETYDNRNVGTGKTLTPTGNVNDGNGGKNYVVTFAANTTGVITQRAVTVTAATNTKVFDGNTSAAAIPIISGGLGAGDTAHFTETYDNRNAGIGKTLTPAGAIDDGNGGNNYVITFATNKTGAITGRALTVTAATNTKLYDGTTSAAAVPSITGGTLLAGDTAAFTETYDNKNVGTGKTLNGGGTVNDGNGGKNYVVTFVADTTGAITARAITVTAVTNTKVYDATTSAAATPTITGGPLAPGDTNGFTEVYDNKNVGIGKTLTPSGAVNDGNGGHNYTVTYVTNNTGVITKASLTLTAQTNTKAYDGTRSAAAVPAIAGLQGADTVTNLTETYDNRSVGTGKTLTVASYTVNDGNNGGNYTVTTVKDKTGVITVPDICVSIKPDSPSITEPPEGSAPIPYTFTITLCAEPAPNFAVTVYYSTADGTADSTDGAQSDFQGKNSYKETFFNGQPLTRKVTVLINGEAYEGVNPETFTVNLIGAYNAHITPAGRTAIGVINQIARPLPVTVSIDAAYTQAHPNTGSTLFDVPIRLTNGPATLPVTVYYATGDSTDTAQDGIDYQGVIRDFITIPAGQTSALIPITVYANPAAHTGLTFTITLYHPINAPLINATSTVTIAYPQLAATTLYGPPAPGGIVLTSVDQLTPIISAAEDYWIAAGYSASKFTGTSFVIANMGHGVLGSTTGSVITIDSSADGFGWFVDPSPLLNEEFQRKSGSTNLFARPGTLAAAHMDLLTVVEHELGHILGFDDVISSTANSLMSQTLGLGVRRLPTGTNASAAALNHVFAALGSAKLNS